jgi:hypothetical protein
MSSKWEALDDEELANFANGGLTGQGAVVWAMRRLRISNEKLTQQIIRLTRMLVGFTIVIMILTAILIVQGARLESALHSH